jgi:hypothetical protein
MLYTFQYNFSERAFQSPLCLESILQAKDQAAAHQIDDAFGAVVAGGMTRSIFCEELWDYPVPSDADSYFLWQLANTCSDFKDISRKMKFAPQLAAVKARTIIMGGTLDHVLPIEGMREMHKLLRNSVLLENHFTGHEILSQKFDCGTKLITMLMAGVDLATIQAEADGQACQSAPVPDPVLQRECIFAPNSATTRYHIAPSLKPGGRALRRPSGSLGI